MNFFEVALIFAGIPLLVVLLLAMVTVVPNRSKARPKYEPGKPWEFSDRFYTGDTKIQVPSHLIDAPLGGARGTW